MKLYVGTDNTLSYYLNGYMDELRMWSDVRTEAEIRANMFTEVSDSASNLEQYHRFNTGSGSTASASAGSSLGLYDGGSSSTGLWAGAGTFTQGTSTLTMTGTSKKINTKGNTGVYNLTISGTTSLTEVTGGYSFSVNNNLTVDASKTLSSTASEILKITNGASATVTLNNTAGLANLFTLRPSHSSGTLSLPELTTKKLLLDTSGGTTQATGNHTYTTELEVNSGTTFNANGNTIDVDILDVNGGTLDMRNSDFIIQSGGAVAFHGATGDKILTGNTTLTGHSSANKADTYVPAAGNFEIVGDVKFLKLDAGASDNFDLTVIGAVIDCDASAAGANIRQWHHTLDTQQLLDADEAGDDDLRLTKPALDNALELMTK
jgi:hypothetical protein